MHPVPQARAPIVRPGPALAVAAVAAATVLAIGIHVRGGTTGGRVDDRVSTVVDTATDGHLWSVRELTFFGSPPFVVAAAFLLAGIALAARRPALAALAVLGPGLAGLTIIVLKPLFGRTIDESGYAFPSGHTSGATSIALVGTLLLVGILHGRAGSLLGPLAFALVCGGVVGAGMVAIGAHYPTDTVGGFCSAVAVVLGCALLIDRVTGRRRPRDGTRGPRD